MICQPHTTAAGEQVIGFVAPPAIVPLHGTRPHGYEVTWAVGPDLNSREFDDVLAAAACYAEHGPAHANLFAFLKRDGAAPRTLIFEWKPEARRWVQ